MGRQEDESYKNTLLKKDANLRRWYNNLKEGSIITAEVGLRRMGRACRLFNTTPAKLAKMSKKQATDFLIDLVAELRSQGKQPKYISHFVKVMKNWFGFNGIQITERIKVSNNAKKPSKVAKEQSPTPEQFRLVLNQADIKQKVECTLVGFAGLREETIGDYLGEDGLKVMDLPEMKVDKEEKTVTFEKIPTMIIVRPNLSKAGHQYITFMPDEGCQYIKQLLELRMSNGETLTAESPIDTSLKWHGKALKGGPVGHITTRKIGTSMKKPIVKAGFDWRPYILRTYFDTRMMMAQNDGLIIKDWRVFWMGHTGDIDAVYTTNKPVLPPDLIEKMREAFAKAAEKNLVTVSKREAISAETINATIRRGFLEMSGMSEEEIEKLGDLSKLTTEEVRDLVKERSKTDLGLKGNSQKVVPLAEVRTYITDGWEYVRDLPPGDAIIKLPS